MKVLIADDHQIVRQGLRALLESKDDMQVIGEASDGRMAVQMARESGPDVVIMDVAMPNLNGIEATRRILSDAPGTKVVALSVHTDRRYTAEMLRAGASGYVAKDGAFEELEQAVRTVTQGKVYLSPRVTGGFLGEFMQQANAASPQRSVFDTITPREREVLQLISEGQATKEIARTLGVSVK